MCHHSTCPCICSMVSVYLLLEISCWSRGCTRLRLCMCYRSTDIFYNILSIHHHNNSKLGICKSLIKFSKCLLYHRYRNFQRLNKSNSCNDKRDTINQKSHHNTLLRICMCLHFGFAQIHCYTISMMQRQTMNKSSMSNGKVGIGQYLELHFRSIWLCKRIFLQQQIGHDGQLLNRMLSKWLILGKFCNHIYKLNIINLPHHHSSHLCTGKESMMYSKI